MSEENQAPEQGSPLAMDDAAFEEQFAQMMANEAESVVDPEAMHVDNREEEKATFAGTGAEPEEEAPSEQEPTDSMEQELVDEGQDADGDEPIASDPVTTDDGDAVSNTGSDYERVFQPFKANGQQVQVNNADEAITLMQMGANYTKKMQQLQPHLKVVRALEKANLLDQEKLNHLIDLANGDKGAINKLIQDTGYESSPYEEDTEKEYTPTDHSVSDKELQLQDVIDRIKDSEHYPKTVDVVTKQWDDSSKEVLLEKPQYIEVLNQHMESGVYQTIQQEITRQRMFGGLAGVSDFEAYNQIGAAMQQQGKFGQQQTQPTPNQQQVQQQAQVKQQNQARDQRRRAAAPTKGAPPKGKARPNFNPLALSDEEFAKLDINDFLV